MAIALTEMQYSKLISDFFAWFKNILLVKIKNNSNYLFKTNYSLANRYLKKPQRLEFLRNKSLYLGCWTQDLDLTSWDDVAIPHGQG